MYKKKQISYKIQTENLKFKITRNWLKLKHVKKCDTNLFLYIYISEELFISYNTQSPFDKPLMETPFFCQS